MSLPPASPSSVGGRSDAESDAEQGSTGTPARLEGATKDEVVAMFKKQERVLARYKTRFSEVHVVNVLWRFVVCLFVCFVLAVICSVQHVHCMCLFIDLHTCVCM